MLDMLQADCELDDIVDIDLDTNGEVLAAKNDKIALIDADTIAFAACLSTEVAIEVLDKSFYTDSEWQDITTNHQYDSTENVIYETDITQALARADTKIRKILDNTGCESVELHFTGGRDNFRYSVFKDYKANRTGRAPAGLSDLKDALVDKHNGTIHTKWEADDMVVYLKSKYPDKYILVAIDKDVLNSVEGRHFNYYESHLYNIDMKWIEVDRYTTMVWRYLQTLMGDKVDNIIGLKGIGPKKAEKLLAGCFTHKDLWIAVCDAYEAKGRTIDEALMNLNLVDMKLLYINNKGELEIKLRTHKELLKNY